MDKFNLKKYLTEGELIKENSMVRENKNQNINEMNYEAGMSNRYVLYQLRENREKLIRLYAQLANNNKASWKVYDSMIFEIEDARDNIYPNWKKNLIKADEEHLDLMNQINSALERDKLLRSNIK